MPAATENFLHPLFGDHMVLQQGGKVPIWGKTKPRGKVAVTLAGRRRSTVAQRDGMWMIHFNKLKAGGPFELTVRGPQKQYVVVKDVYVGEVWLCSGQSNMDQRVAQGKFYWCGVENEAVEIAAANHPQIRLYSTRLQLADQPRRLPASEKNQHVDPNTPPHSGQWTVCSPETVGDFSAIAYFFARELQAKIKTPIGLITSCYGASTIQAWTSRPALRANPRLAHLPKQYQTLCAEFVSGECYVKFKHAIEEWKKTQARNKKNNIVLPRHLTRPPPFPKDPHLDQHSPSVLYNGMIAPLAPYAIKGAVWCHGESNGATAKLYFSMLQTLIADWRRAWGTNLGFLIVQLQNMNEPNEEPLGRQQIVLLRDAQVRAHAIENTGSVATIDLGTADLHFRNKQALGRRLTLTARGQFYGARVAYNGPLFDKMTITDHQARIHFRHAEGLHSPKPLRAFIMAGADGKFHWAKARIDGETVVVTCAQVPQPVAVRYAWGENPAASLYNRHGLPASPFRTDQPADA